MHQRGWRARVGISIVGVAPQRCNQRATPISLSLLPRRGGGIRPAESNYTPPPPPASQPVRARSEKRGKFLRRFLPRRRGSWDDATCCDRAFDCETCDDDVYPVSCETLPMGIVADLWLRIFSWVSGMFIDCIWQNSRRN